MTGLQFFKWVLNQNLSEDQIQIAGVLFATYGSRKAKEFIMDCQSPKTYVQSKQIPDRGNH